MKKRTVLSVISLSRVMEDEPLFALRCSQKFLLKPTIENLTITSLFNITANLSQDDMCIIAVTTDQPTPCCQTVKRECSLGLIDQHSLRPFPPPSDSTPRMPHRTSTTQERMLKPTTTVYESEEMDTGRMSNKRVNQENSYGQESAAGRLHSRWSSSSRVDRPPSLSCRQMSGGLRVN